MSKRRVLGLACGLPASLAVVYALFVTWLGLDFGRPSVCHGSAVTGSLERGRRLPYSGANFRSYSTLGYLLGRTFVHSSVRKAVVEAYAEVARQRPELRFVYAETSWPWGGNFAPHKTHANGTSVDFHVPVRAQGGEIDELPTWLFNKWGYAVDFDQTGVSGSYRIDFEAMALHLQALERAAKANGIGIRRVIFDPILQGRLFATKPGAQLAGRMSFMRTQAWVRHDEHYHVDFDVRCQ